jgi:hypothetical protein
LKTRAGLGRPPFHQELEWQMKKTITSSQLENPFFGPMRSGTRIYTKKEIWSS